MITYDEVRSRLSYCPESGKLTWLKKTGRKAAGMEAGHLSATHGYVVVGLGCSNHLAHRLAFLLMTGEWPDGDIDHINGVRADNRWSNLRPCSRAENMQNVKPRRRLTGQWRAKNGRYRSCIKAYGISHHLGYFDTAEEASAAYTAAKARFHEFSPDFRKE